MSNPNAFPPGAETGPEHTMPEHALNRGAALSQAVLHGAVTYDFIEATLGNKSAGSDLELGGRPHPQRPYDPLDG